jgi:hypothetical protein
MPIKDNETLYSSVRELCGILSGLGADELAISLRGALVASSLPGEVLGEIGLSLKRIRGHEAYGRVDVRRRVDDAFDYLRKTIGMA